MEITQAPETSLTCELVKSHSISDESSLAKAGDLLGAVKALQAEVKSAFRPGIQAADALHSLLIEQESKHYKPLVEAERLIKAKISAFQDEVKAAQKVLERISAETGVLAVMPDTVVPKGVESIENWKYEIEDESLLPREYLMPNTAKIGKDVRSSKGNASIPGVKVWSESGIRYRSR